MQSKSNIHSTAANHERDIKSQPVRKATRASGYRKVHTLSGCIEIRISSKFRSSIVHTVGCANKLGTVSCAQTTVGPHLKPTLVPGTARGSVQLVNWLTASFYDTK